eukprot:151216-Rhodomonas_salina.1
MTTTTTRREVEEGRGGGWEGGSCSEARKRVGEEGECAGEHAGVAGCVEERSRDEGRLKTN